MKISDEVEKLRVDARFGKDKHFSAADRLRIYHYWLGLPVIFIGVFLGSAVFTQVELLPNPWQEAFGAFLAFLSALLASLQTFVNPKEMEKGHRAIANRYLDISRKCRLLLAKSNEQLILLEDVSEAYEGLLSSYNETNIEAEAFPISKNDFQNAVKQSETKVT